MVLVSLNGWLLTLLVHELLSVLKECILLPTQNRLAVQILVKKQRDIIAQLRMPMGGETHRRVR
jgi:hypothetical protein